MIKQIFIPLVVAGQDRGDLLELYIEPCWLKPRNCFKQLANAGLNEGILLAEKALSQLKITTGCGMIYSYNTYPLLSNSLGTAIGLVLASIISLKSCPYQTVIVNAILEDKDEYPLKYNGFWLEKLSGILKLTPAQRTPLLLAPYTPITDEQQQQLFRQNIDTVIMTDLKQAVDFCLTPIKKTP